MEDRVRRAEWLVLVALLLVASGCGGSGASLSKIDYGQVRGMTDLYSKYLGEHRDQPPPDEKAFRDYLATKQDILERFELTIDQFFLSPRSIEPLVWVYGKTPPTGRMGTYFAYEQIPVEGKRLVIGTLGMYEEMDEAQFRATFPDAK